MCTFCCTHTCLWLLCACACSDLYEISIYLINKKIGHLLSAYEWVEWTRFEETTCIFLIECSFRWILAICIWYSLIPYVKKENSPEKKENFILRHPSKKHKKTFSSDLFCILFLFIRYKLQKQDQVVNSSGDIAECL